MEQKGYAEVDSTYNNDEYIEAEFFQGDFDKVEQMTQGFLKPYKELYDALDGGKIRAFKIACGDGWNIRMMHKSPRDGVKYQLSHMIINNNQEMIPTHHDNINDYNGFVDALNGSEFWNAKFKVEWIA